jgi:hypothetical protein
LGYYWRWRESGSLNTALTGISAATAAALNRDTVSESSAGNCSASA